MSKLWLEIEPEDCEPFEVDCECINIHAPNIPDADRIIRDRCPTCHGTGKHMVRLVGMIEVEEDPLNHIGFYCLNTKGIRIRAKIPDILSHVGIAGRLGNIPAELYANTDDPNDARLREVSE